MLNHTISALLSCSTQWQEHRDASVSLSLHFCWVVGESLVPWQNQYLELLSPPFQTQIASVLGGGNLFDWWDGRRSQTTHPRTCPIAVNKLKIRKSQELTLHTPMPPRLPCPMGKVHFLCGWLHKHQLFKWIGLWVPSFQQKGQYKVAYFDFIFKLLSSSISPSLKS